MGFPPDIDLRNFIHVNPNKQTDVVIREEATWNRVLASNCPRQASRSHLSGDYGDYCITSCFRANDISCRVLGLPLLSFPICKIGPG